MKSRKSGFTLVELMVVAIIVAILAAVAIPLMTANKNRAIATEAEAGCGTIRTALRIYYAEHNTYPSAAGVSATNLTGIGATDLDGTYFDTPSYTYSSTASGFTITADGDDSTAPKEGDAAGIKVELNQDGEWTRTGV